MPTQKQSDASRRNSQKSTGPRTPEGKANSRFNALKHGINAKEQFMFGEIEEDLVHLTAEFHEEYQPTTPTQRFLVDALINNEWRLRRLRCVEAELWQHESDQAFHQKSESAPANTTLTTSAGETFAHGLKSFIAVQRVISACERHFHRALKELQSLQTETLPPQSAAPAPQPQHPQPTSAPPASFYQFPNPASEPIPAPSTCQPAAPPNQPDAS